MITRLRAIASLFITAAPLLSACVQMPTEKAGIPDMRPQLSFRLSDENLGSARVLVDGLDMGTAESFLEGAASLRLLPGSHILRVVLQGRALLDERIYLADGTQRTVALTGVAP